MRPNPNHREVYAKCLGISETSSLFDVQFHDGYQKQFTIDQAQCRANRMSERDLLENLIIEYYEETEGIQPHLFIFFM